MAALPFSPPQLDGGGKLGLLCSEKWAMHKMRELFAATAASVLFIVLSEMISIALAGSLFHFQGPVLRLQPWDWSKGWPRMTRDWRRRQLDVGALETGLDLFHL